MTVFCLILPLSFVSSLLATPLVRRVAMARGIYDLPNGYLRPHDRPIPRLGGVAIFLGVLVGSFAALAWGVEMERGTLAAVLLASSFVFVVGLVDDLRGMNRYLRLGGHLMAGLTLALVGLRVNIIPWALVSIPLTLLYVAGAINALNLLDGLDGLAGGVAAIACVGFLVLLAGHGGHASGLAVAAALLGGILGFLPYNASPASIFMGDCGSTLLGMGLAVLAVEASTESHSLSAFLAPLALLGLPIFDTSLAIGRRILNRRPIFLGDRGHFYDQLVDRGHTPKATVTICYLLGLGFVVLGLSIAQLSNILAFMVFSLVILALIGSTIKLGMLRV